MRENLIVLSMNDAHVPNTPAAHLGRLGILLEDPIHRRLIDGVSAQLELLATELPTTRLTRADLEDFELLVADEPTARHIRTLFAEPTDHVAPALVAARPRTATQDSTEHPQSLFDGLLLLPEQPTVVVAQLSVILYAHRAYATRFQSALEELQLNRRIFRSVTSGITIARVADEDMPLVYVNPAFEVITGYSAEESEGRNCRFLQGEDTDQPGLTALRDAIRGQREVTTLLRNYRKDGTLFWNELSLSPIRNRQGVVTHFVGIQNDVTARIEYENTLRESEKLATAGRLAASIAHEINNPLEAVTNLLYLARTADQPTDTLRYVKQAEIELQRVALLTSQSLKFYRQSTAPTVVRPGELLESILDLYTGRLDATGIRLQLRESTQVPIACLESEIRQVLSNLIRNAIDAMRPSGGRLIVRTRATTNPRTGKPRVVFTIADTGCGMSPITLKRMYDAFYTTKGIHGTGLGLWVSQEIVARHRGHLTVRSRNEGPTTGTVFQLSLPADGLPG
jgi:PAS domain S-box-containing protein